MKAILAAVLMVSVPLPPAVAENKKAGKDGTPKKVARPVWDYTVESLPGRSSTEEQTNLLQKRGAQGWELVSVINVDNVGTWIRFYFKRLKESAGAPSKPAG